MPSKSNEPTWRAERVHAMLGWFHESHASLVPSGLKVGDETKSDPPKIGMISKALRAARPSRGIATRELTGSPGFE